MTLVAPPEQGQLVQVRQRQYVVADVVKSHVLLPGLPAHHRVSLQSVEDDALDEELEVIWELEPGAQAHGVVPLPTPRGVDAPATLQALLDAVRWGAISSLDQRSMHAPFRAGIDLEDYQLEPLARALRTPRVRLLLADDVGMGKTIEAGLVIQELLLRHRARSVLVVCPSSLQAQWRTQMRDRFGLDFRIVDSALLRELRRARGLHANPWTHFPRLITSVDFLKQARPLSLLREVLPRSGQAPSSHRFDVLVVDEAHGVAPSGRGCTNGDSLRTQAIRMLAPHCEHRLFLTATPDDGPPGSLDGLLELLDPEHFTRMAAPSPEHLAAVMVRRLKTDLEDSQGQPRFPARELRPIRVDLGPEETRIHALFQEYMASRLRDTRNDVERFAAEFVLKALKKRLLSSAAAFGDLLARHEHSMAATRQGFALPSMAVLRQQVERLDEEFADDDVLESCTLDLVDTATRLLPGLSPSEHAFLGRMRRETERASRRPDARLKALLHWLEETLRPAGRWLERKVVIFTEFRATQEWLRRQFTSHGFAEGDRLGFLHGGMDLRRQEALKAAFQASPAESGLRILVATDAASEGIDLQNHCARLVHYELPWDPRRLQQRNGRLDRHGQRGYEDDHGARVRAVLIHHFVGACTTAPADGSLEGDLAFLHHVAERVTPSRADVGSVGTRLAQAVEDAMLGRSPSPEDGASPPAQGIRAQEPERFTHLVKQWQETRRSLHLHPENVERVVAEALRLAGQPTLTPELLPDGRRVLHVPSFGGSTWNLCAMGLEHPHTGRIRPLTFDAEVARGRDDVVLAHLNHRLVQQAVRVLRAECWSQQDRGRLHRCTAREVPAGILSSPAVVGHARLLVIGCDRRRLHEETITAGLRFGGTHDGSAMTAAQTREALDAAAPSMPAQKAVESLLDAWPAHEEAMRNLLDERARERTAQLEQAAQGAWEGSETLLFPVALTFLQPEATARRG